MKVWFGHIASGIGPALNSLKYSAITVATTVLGFMATSPDQPLQSPQMAGQYLQTHWWGILIGAFILPAIRGTQATANSVKAQNAGPSTTP